MSAANQRIIDNVNKEMAEIARKRKEAEKSKALNPPINSKETLLMQPLMGLSVESTNPFERTAPKTSVVFDTICFKFYRGNCNFDRCKYNHYIPSTDRILERLKTLNKYDFLGVFNACVSMTTLLKQCWSLFINVATFNKWIQFLNFMIETSDAYPLEDINNIWRAVFNAFTECNLTKPESVTRLIETSSKFRKLPQVEVLIDLMVETNLVLFLKEIIGFVKLFKAYQANAFVIGRFYETAIIKQDPEFLKLTHSLACNMNPSEAYNVDPDLIKRFGEIYFSIFPVEN